MNKAGRTYELGFKEATADRGTPVWEVTLRPHRSLSNKGFSNVILVTSIALAFPLFAFLGSAVLWGLLPFALGALWMLWTAIRASDRDGTLTEHLMLWPDLIAVHRHNPRTDDQFWHANPFWVSTHLKHTREVRDYLTVKGAGREIELGRFLTPQARKELFADLNRQLSDLAL
ncbi:MAG: DUF2244 domain-containing protein [Pseudomonadota bacterium]